MSRNQ